MTVKTTMADAPVLVVPDGSRVRELMHPAVHGNRNQSLAEARLHPGEATLLHCHRTSEELYFILQGAATFTLAGRHLEVGAGDTVLIPPGTEHRIENTGPGELQFLCCCSPPYSDSDTHFP